jgi:hypothetical protein
MKTLLVCIALTLSSLSFAQQLVTAEKNNEGADLCYLKQIQLKGYAFANNIGRCAWDPAMNGMSLTLVAVPEDPTKDADTISLDYVRNVKLVQNKEKQLQVTFVQDTFDAKDNVIQKTKVIYVCSVHPEKALFSIKN